MRAQRKLAVPLPLRVAAVLAAAVEAVRERTGMPLSLGTCLAAIARHFVDTWRGAVKRSRSRSWKARDRNDGYCQVPGCSHRATRAHHVLFRSHGGGDDLDNQIGVCAFHHLRCIHGGHVRVVGRRPMGCGGSSTGTGGRGRARARGDVPGAARGLLSRPTPPDPPAP